jgi:hypothetical protein
LDFKLGLEKNKLCRVSFNFKISQGVHLKLQNTFTDMRLTEPRREG